jgi:Tannase and feruloyl esterase
MLRVVTLGVSAALFVAQSATVFAQTTQQSATATRELVGAVRCADLAGAQSTGTLGDMGAIVTAAKLLPAQAASASAPAWPEHCEVFGKLHERQGLYGQTYAIHFHLRLPTDWNHRFFFQGGAGVNGVVGNAFGNLQGDQPIVALSLGYTVVSQDGGHDKVYNNDPERSGNNTFSWDPEARIENAYASQAAVTVTAKALIESYYGAAPAYSYFVACSKGGQEGMAMSQRYPDYFDGIIADAPGFALPKTALAQVWNTQVFADLARKEHWLDANGLPSINKTFTDADLALVATGILAACDRLDGLADGIVTNFPACTTRRVVAALNQLVCQGTKTAACLSANQVAALTKAFAGPHNSKGEALYSDWAWDAGIGAAVDGKYYTTWRQAILGGYNDAVGLSPGATSLATSFFSPPVQLRDDPSDYLRFALSVDFDRDAPKIFQSSGAYSPSAWDMTSARSVDRTAFKMHGGKMLVMHGVSDPVFSINDTLAWWNDLNQVEQGHAADFVRVFPVPGMAHCRGGPGTVQFDAFTALVNWVEEASPPTRIVGTAPEGTPWPKRTRPLCAYPNQARYKGGGIEDAHNFICSAPRNAELSK